MYEKNDKYLGYLDGLTIALRMESTTGPKRRSKTEDTDVSEIF